MAGAYLLPQTPGASPIYFDVVEQETVERDAEITQHPVEQGANIADHYRVKLNSVKLDVFVSQEPLDPSLHAGGFGAFNVQTLALPSYPDVPLLSNVATILANPVGSVIRGLRTPPTSVNVNALQWSTPFDSLTDLLNMLESLRTNSTLFDVVTKSWYYASFLLGAVTTKRDAKTGTGTQITLECKQVRLVTTQKVAAPALPLKPKDTTPVNKGTQNPKDPGQYTSSGAQLYDAVASYFTGGGT
jgi:hypothetical protein